MENTEGFWPSTAPASAMDDGSDDDGEEMGPPAFGLVLADRGRWSSNFCDRVRWDVALRWSDLDHR